MAWPWKGRKNPEQSERMRRNNPMKLEDVCNKFRGKKRPDVSEYMRGNQLNKGRKSSLHGKFMKEHNPMKNLELRKLQSLRMRNGRAGYVCSCNKNPSKPQVLLYEKVKGLYSSAILNHPCLNYCIDIAIPELNIAIEFDGYYWHQGQRDQDTIRQYVLEAFGWKFIRYETLPDETDLIEKLRSGDGNIQ